MSLLTKLSEPWSGLTERRRHLTEVLTEGGGGLSEHDGTLSERRPELSEALSELLHELTELVATSSVR